MNEHQQSLARAHQDRAFLRSVMLSVSKLSVTWRVSRSWMQESLLNDAPIPVHAWKWLVTDLIRQRCLKRCDSALVRGAIARLRAAQICAEGGRQC